MLELFDDLSLQASVSVRRRLEFSPFLFSSLYKLEAPDNRQKRSFNTEATNKITQERKKEKKGEKKKAEVPKITHAHTNTHA